MGVFSGRSVLCIAETPWQVLVAGNVFSMQGVEHDSCTLVVYAKFPDASGLAGRAAGSGIFDEVVLLPQKKGEARTLYGVRGIASVTIGARSAKARYMAALPELAGRRFDVLACAGVTSLTLAAKRFSVVGGYTVFFDDGTGSHTGAVFRAFSFLDYAFLAPQARAKTVRDRIKLVAKRPIYGAFSRARFDPREIWLVAPTQADADRYSAPVRSIDVAEGLVLADVASMERASLECVYLALPRDVSERAKRCEARVIDDLIAKFGAGFAVKVHPRGDAPDPKDGLNLLPEGEPWEEMVASGLVGGGTVLVAGFSTAQMTPKDVFGLEPRLVFLFKLFPDVFNAESAQLAVGELAARYSDPGRIRVVEGWGDFRGIF